MEDSKFYGLIDIIDFYWHHEKPLNSCQKEQLHDAMIELSKYGERSEQWCELAVKIINNTGKD